MEKELKKILLEIRKNYRKRYNLKSDEKIFKHLIRQIKKHIYKLPKIRKKSRKGLFKREVADLYLLSLNMAELEKVNKKTVMASARYYLKKTQENFPKDKHL